MHQTTDFLMVSHRPICAPVEQTVRVKFVGLFLAYLSDLREKDASKKALVFVLLKSLN